MIRVIGDVHGLVSRVPTRREYLAQEAKEEQRTYLKIIEGVENSVQLGDLGWRDDLEPFRDWTVNPNFHKVIYGNHDDYDNWLPHAYGDYGIAVHGGVTFGYIRGEFSIDWQRRSHDGPNKSWWSQEEIDWHTWNDVLDFFDNVGTLDLMITHGCPASLFACGAVTNPGKYSPSRTAQALDSLHMMEGFHVKNWIFGHHHQNWRYTDPVTQTKFICLNELCYVDIDEQYRISETK